jgi:hypothetical protein
MFPATGVLRVLGSKIPINRIVIYARLVNSPLDLLGPVVHHALWDHGQLAMDPQLASNAWKVLSVTELGIARIVLQEHGRTNLHTRHVALVLLGMDFQFQSMAKDVSRALLGFGHYMQNLHVDLAPQGNILQILVQVTVQYALLEDSVQVSTHPLVLHVNMVSINLPLDNRCAKDVIRSRPLDIQHLSAFRIVYAQMDIMEFLIKHRHANYASF